MRNLTDKLSNPAGVYKTIDVKRNRDSYLLNLKEKEIYNKINLCARNVTKTCFQSFTKNIFLRSSSYNS